MGHIKLAKYSPLVLWKNFRLVRRLEKLSADKSFRILNEDAARKIVFSPKYRFFYNRIEKNANSTIMVLLAQLNRVRSDSANNAKRAKIGLKDLSEREWRNLASYRSLVVSRNPFGRTLSAFLDKFSQQKYIDRFGHFSTDPDGFRSFCKWLAEGGMSEDTHWDLQVKQLFMPTDCYTDVVRFENIEDELGEFLTSVGVPAHEIDFDRPTKIGAFHATNAQNKLLQYYDPETEQRIARLYEDDFDAFGYSRQLQRAALNTPDEVCMGVPREEFSA